MLRLICVTALLAACSGDEKGDTAPTVPATSETLTPTPVVRDPKFDAVSDVLLAELGPNLASGVSIAVSERGVITWAEGFGTADPDAEVPIDPDMLFQIGSTTKQMTAALVLQQVEDGTLALDTPMSDVLPEFSMRADATWATNATLHLLLSHQGGLYDTLDWFGDSADEELERWYLDVYGPSYFAMSPPGAFWNYANPNFALSGLAVEAHDPAGRFYADVLTEDLFAPLGMSRTFARKADVVSDGNFALSTGYADLTTPEFQSVAMRQLPDSASTRPAGLVWSTPTDMCAWGSFLIHGDPAVLDDALRAGITTPHVSTLYYDEHLAYGYGEFVWDLYPLSDGFYPIRVWEHGGNTLSFTSVFLVLPDQDVVISILSNGYGDLWPETTEALIRAVVDPLPPISAYEGPGFDPSKIDAHVGLYSDPFNVGDLIVTSDGAGGLLIDAPLLDAYDFVVDPVLVPGSTDIWYMSLDGAYLELTFVRDPVDGTSRYVRNRSFVAARSDDVAARKAPPSRDAVERWIESVRVATPLPAHGPTPARVAR